MTRSNSCRKMTDQSIAATASSGQETCSTHAHTPTARHERSRPARCRPSRTALTATTAHEPRTQTVDARPAEELAMPTDPQQQPSVCVADGGERDEMCETCDCPPHSRHVPPVPPEQQLPVRSLIAEVAAEDSIIEAAKRVAEVDSPGYTKSEAERVALDGLLVAVASLDRFRDRPPTKNKREFRLSVAEADELIAQHGSSDRSAMPSLEHPNGTCRCGQQRVWGSTRCAHCLGRQATINQKLQVMCGSCGATLAACLVAGGQCCSGCTHRQEKLPDHPPHNPEEDTNAQ